MSCCASPESDAGCGNYFSIPLYGQDPAERLFLGNPVHVLDLRISLYFKKPAFWGCPALDDAVYGWGAMRPVEEHNVAFLEVFRPGGKQGDHIAAADGGAHAGAFDTEPHRVAVFQ
jgi:hypothetical protein